MKIPTLEDYRDIKKCKTYHEALNEFIGLNIPEQVGNVIFAFIPQIVNYVEEDRRLSFKLAIGAEKFDSPYGDCFPIKKISLRSLQSKNANEETNKVLTDIEKYIKGVVPFCNTFTNVLIRFDAERSTLNVGIYTAMLDTFKNQDEFLLSHGYTIFSPANDTGIIARKKREAMDETLYIPLDFGFKNPIPEEFDIQPRFYSKTCRYWDGLFERVRRQVHGTICLIVAPEYRFEDDLDTRDRKYADRNFTGGTSVRIENVIESSEKMDLFLSMLNYDGITILNTNGDVVAYNAKGKTDSEHSVPGGMRHQACAYLANKKREHYVGLYFQSQEGEIKFYDYTGDKPVDYFDCRAMIPARGGKEDSEFAFDIDNKIQKDLERIESMPEQIETRKGMTSALYHFFEYLEDGNEEIALANLNHHDDIFEDIEWERYFVFKDYLNEKLLRQLSQPLAEERLQFLRRYFMMKQDRAASASTFRYLHTVFVLEGAMLRYNHLEFEDMYQALLRRKHKAGWDERLNDLY